MNKANVLCLYIYIYMCVCVCSVCARVCDEFNRFQDFLAQEFKIVIES